MHTYIRALAGLQLSGQQPLSAGCSEYCMHRVCAMPSQPGTACSICLMGPTIGIGTHLCQIVVQLGLYSCTCLLPSPGVLFLAAGFVQHAVLPTQPGTGSMGVSDRPHANKHAYIPLCFLL
jgi:hypothetical protein